MAALCFVPFCNTAVLSSMACALNRAYATGYTVAFRTCQPLSMSSNGMRKQTESHELPSAILQQSVI
jgi:hypothetical protein